MAIEDSTDGDFTAFVDAHGQRLLRTAYLLVGDAHRAEDMLQTALVKAYEHRGRIREPAAAYAYTRKCLANAVVSWRRLRMTHERPTDTISDTSSPDIAGRHAESTLMAQYLRLLPRRQRTVLVLRFYEDLSEAEVARTLGVSAGTVKSTASRGLARLRELMADQACGHHRGGHHRRSRGHRRVAAGRQLRDGATKTSAGHVRRRRAAGRDRRQQRHPPPRRPYDPGARAQVRRRLVDGRAGGRRLGPRQRADRGTGPLGRDHEEPGGGKSGGPVGESRCHRLPRRTAGRSVDDRNPQQ